MWWSFRRSKRVRKRGRVTISRTGVSGSYGTRRARAGLSKRGVGWTFKLFGIRFGGRL